MLTLPTPATVLSTTPTGGVIRPIKLLIRNNTPKKIGSTPAALTSGISTRTAEEIADANPASQIIRSLTS